MVNKYDILISPLLTEKNTFREKIGKYTFKVVKSVGKADIKSSIESIYSLDVLNVNIVNVKGKKKLFKGIQGFRSSFKKAIVTFASKKTVDILKVKA